MWGEVLVSIINLPLQSYCIVGGGVNLPEENFLMFWLISTNLFITTYCRSQYWDLIILHNEKIYQINHDVWLFVITCLILFFLTDKAYYLMEGIRKNVCWAKWSKHMQCVLWIKHRCVMYPTNIYLVHIINSTPQLLIVS